MNELQVGKTRIPYTVTRSPNARKRRMSLTPDALEVVVPAQTTDAEVKEFLKSRSTWIKENVEILRDSNPHQPWPRKFTNGAKVLFHGRYLPVTLHFTASQEVTVEQHPDSFYIRAPFEVAFNDRDVILQEAFREFYATSLKRTVRELVSKFAGRLDIKAPEANVGEVEDGIGYFNERGEPVFSTALILAPKFALEYVVLHELAALKLRTRGKEFWRVIESVMPDYRLRAEWIKQNRALLTSGQI
ncbi:MAG: DUF45 domain-containing protein [Bdellovibrionales bacterium]|nr:DUF45 domain-containing protein [Bdellovibrionales bacterium]